ncbi:MAG: amidohydrolase family protein [Ilumatobacteraceae bacterium]
MASEHDLVIRRGTIVDGTGAEPFEADVALAGGRIVAVGADLTRGREEIDAAGMLVTPGFVDIHTHYDGQVIWEDRLTPSSDHGVTTIVTGNCGVGFAPCRPEDHDELIELMAGVEDIPEVVMTEGLSWAWESFPEYLDAVDSRPHDLDIAAMLPHSALRVYVMGARAVNREPATPDDIAQMAALTKEAIEAGAVGFGTSRALQQRSSKGEPIPTVRAAEDELRAILGAMAECGSGVFQLLSDFFQFDDVDGEFAMLRRIVEQTGRPMSFTLNQKHSMPDGWRRLLELTTEAAADGVPIKAQVLGRPTGLMLGHDLTVSPFAKSATYAELSTLPLGERVEEMRHTDVRARILDELDAEPSSSWDQRYLLEDPPNYEPEPSASFAAQAARAGTTPQAVAYDALLEDGGRRLILQPFQNYAAGSLDACYEMLQHPSTVLGLGDGGAHCGLVCDASYPTTMLAYWTRDRTRGPRLSVPDVVQSLTSSTASTVGLRDRGVVAPGYRADINVIDYDRLQARLPQVVRDLPAGGRRIVQKANGYVATVVAGTVTARDGESTGALPGRLVRGAQPAPR